MNKKFKLYAISSIAIFMIVTWALIFFSHTVAQNINYYWQVAMGISGFFFAICGITTAAKWGWLKSGVGRAVFFLSLGLLMWSIGQFMWSYYLFKDPNTQAPPARILDVVDFSAIPLFFVGTLMLIRATGARYGLKTPLGKVLVVVVPVVMTALSYYFIVVVARGGTAYFNQPFWNQFFDLGYSAGDAIIATIAIVTFALSWKVLGGRFKLPITVILVGLVLLFFADTVYSYRNSTGEYFNGDIADLLYMLTISALALGLSMLDPGHVRKVAAPIAATPEPISHPVEIPTPDQPTPPPAEVQATTNETTDKIEEESL